VASCPLQDQSGLEGTFDLTLQCRPEQDAPNADLADGLPTFVFTALQEQLGLELESRNGTLVIDRVKHPTEN
jgi:uncharacterized protein (TIGR03435 family)